MFRPPIRKFTPPTDIIELSDRIVVLVEIAGMRADNFSVVVTNQGLVITGVRERPVFDKPAYHQVEIAVGEFRLEFALPAPIEQDGVSARYYDGFLQVDLPRRPDRQIPIVDKTAEQQDQS